MVNFPTCKWPKLNNNGYYSLSQALHDHYFQLSPTKVLVRHYDLYFMDLSFTELRETKETMGKS